MTEMNTLISAFPSNITEALAIASAAVIHKPANEIKNILICGMGGSGIGGRIVGKWVEDEIQIPIHVTSDYTVPAFVNEHTLVIGSSYSGNTEETLCSVQMAVERGAHLIGITSGGKMQQLCEALGRDVIVVPGGNPPRTALAFSLIQLLNIFSKLGLTSSDRLSELEKGRQLIVAKETKIKETARELAGFLKGNVGVIYGTTAYEPILVRARQQLNENSKMLAWSQPVPEMNHNELVGWGGGDDRFAAVFLETTDIHPRNAKRIEITKEAIQKRTSKIMTITAEGESRIERSIHLINIVDWASLYLAEMTDTDPIEIEIIDHLKSSLANF